MRAPFEIISFSLSRHLRVPHKAHFLSLNSLLRGALPPGPSLKENEIACDTSSFRVKSRRVNHAILSERFSFRSICVTLLCRFSYVTDKCHSCAHVLGFGRFYAARHRWRTSNKNSIEGPEQRLKFQLQRMRVSTIATSEERNSRDVTTLVRICAHISSDSIIIERCL